jgi:hypothetical protein
VGNDDGPLQEPGLRAHLLDTLNPHKRGERCGQMPHQAGTQVSPQVWVQQTWLVLLQVHHYLAGHPLSQHLGWRPGWRPVMLQHLPGKDKFRTSFVRACTGVTDGRPSKVQNTWQELPAACPRMYASPAHHLMWVAPPSALQP